MKVKHWVLYGYVALLTAILIIGLLFTLKVFYGGESSDSALGTAAVKYMYSFQTPQELDSNMPALKAITTEEVYKTLTIDRTDRALSVYLKFNNKPSLVQVLDSSSNYIIYSIKSESISANRKFAFFFHTTNGKIDKVRESEIIDFSTNP